MKNPAKRGKQFQSTDKNLNTKKFPKKRFSANCSSGHVEWSFDKLVQCFSSKVLNFFRRISKRNEKNVINFQQNLKISFHSECLSGQKCSFYNPANNLLPTHWNFLPKVPNDKELYLFFAKILSSRPFSGRIECSFDILRLFSTQISKTNFHSMIQCPKTTNSVLTLQKFFTSPHESTRRIHWTLDNANPPATPCPPKFCSKRQKC